MARALNLAGVYLGNLDSIITHDMIPHKDNLRGHWENTKLLQLGEKTLSFSNGSWKDIPQKIVINEEIAQAIEESVKELTNHPSMMAGFKDPRILLCLQAWKPYLPKELMIIGIFRHPLKVAESVKKRNGLSYQKSIDLWKIYNLKLLKYLEENNGFLLNFDWPKEKILSELNQIFDKLGLSRKIDLLEWYTEELITSAERCDSSFELPNDVNEIYTKLLEKSQKNHQVEIIQPKLSENELKAIMDGLLNELQEQGIYFKKILEQKINSTKSLEENNDPYSLLRSIYYKRQDLKKAFPEAKQGDYSRLLNWAKDVCSTKKDWSYDELAKFEEFYLYFDVNEIKNLKNEINEINETKMKLNSLRKDFDKQMKENKQLRVEKERVNSEIMNLKSDLNKIKNSLTWKTLRKIDKLTGKGSD